MYGLKGAAIQVQIAYESVFRGTITNVTNWGNVPNITKITTGAPQACLRCDPSAAASLGKNVTPGTDIRILGTLKSIDEAARQGYREGCAKKRKNFWKIGGCRPGGIWGAMAAPQRMR